MSKAKRPCRPSETVAQLRESDPEYADVLSAVLVAFGEGARRSLRRRGEDPGAEMTLEVMERLWDHGWVRVVFDEDTEKFSMLFWDPKEGRYVEASE